MSLLQTLTVALNCRPSGGVAKIARSSGHIAHVGGGDEVRSEPLGSPWGGACCRSRDRSTA
eukprot:2948734-Alexandrium_andersonii.AAC.1